MGDQVFDKWVANCNVRVVTAVLVQRQHATLRPNFSLLAACRKIWMSYWDALSKICHFAEGLKSEKTFTLLADG